MDLGIPFEENVSLREYTTFKIGGKARYIYFPQSPSELIKLLKYIKKNNIQYFVLGGGSNVLVGDGDFDGIVVSTRKLDKVTISDQDIVVSSGTDNTVLSEKLAAHSLTGAEFLYKLPGSIGGAAVMNARAFNKSMEDIVTKIKVIEPPDKIMMLPTDKLKYGYKSSILQNSNYFVIEVYLKLEKGDPELIKRRMEEYYNKRLATKQYDYPSAGCVFKNDYCVGIPSGKLIDESELKGRCSGDAYVSGFHANFIINKGNATAKDVKVLVETIKREVKEKKNVDLECEIKFLGNFE